MQLTKQQESEILNLYEAFWVSLLNADIDAYAAFLDVDFRLIGTTEQEVFFNKQEAVRFLESTAEQMAGNLERRKSKIDLDAIDSLVLITEQFDAYVLIDNEWKFYGKTRVSSWMKQQPQGWMIVQQHFSFPDTKAEEGQTIGLEKIAKENIELREAIKRRTIELEHKNQELEIETALERVRARSMGMQKSEELKEVIQVVYDQMVQLNILVEHAGFIMDYKERDDMLIWLADEHAIPFQVTLPYFDCAHWNSFKDAKEHGKDFFANLLDFEEKNKFYNDLFVFVPGVPEESLKYYLQCPGLAISTVLLDNVGLYIENFSGIPYTEEENKILMRFGKVFQQTYTRFSDLQKAETQAREARIEAALERVRAASMAMHKSDELLQVIQTLSGQLLQLGIQAEAVSFLTDGDENGYNMWLSSPGEDFLSKIFIPRIQDRTTLLFLEAKEHGKRSYSYVLSKEEKDIYFHNFFNNTVLRDYPDNGKEQVFDAPGMATTNVLLDKIILSVSNFGNMPYSDDDNEIINRIANVFQQSYTRFLDLQKAETQAREAQIEVALERVRSKTIGMQRSEQLGETASILFKQFDDLGIKVWSSGFQIWKDDNISTTAWMSSAGGEVLQTGIRLPHTEDPYFINIYNARNTPVRLFVMESKGKELEETYRYMFNIPEWKKAFGDIEDAGFPIPKYQITHCVYFKHGYLMLITHESYPEYWDIFKRFGMVFEQTYTRFLDLQKAEAQTREAQIEASLERVRASAMAMHRSDELSDVLTVLFEQFDVLKIRPVDVHLDLFDLEKNTFSYRATGKEGKRVIAEQIVDLDSRPEWQALVEMWKSGKPNTVAFSFYPKEVIKELMAFFPDIWTAMPEDAVMSPEDFPDGIFDALGYCKFGYIGFHHNRKATEEEKNILIRFANEFERLYQRFLDLQKAEAQAREAKIEAALERIRSKSLAMYKTDDLRDVVGVLFEQMQGLSVDMGFASVSIFIFEEGSRNIRQWLHLPDGVTSLSVPYFHHPILSDLFDARDNGADYFAKVYTLEEKNTWIEIGFELTDYKDLPEEFKTSLLQAPGYAMSITLAKNSGICIPSFVGSLPFPEDVEILKRVGKVFEQAYIRFLDLKKAEAQAREARIEAALEKVRTRTMAMQKGEELQDVAVLLYKELIALGVSNFVSCGYVEINEKVNKQYVWITSPGGDSLGLFYLPLTGDATFDERYAAWKSQQVIFHQSVAGEVRSNHLEFAITTFNSKEAEEMVRSQFPDPTVFYCFNFSHGYLHIVTGSVLKQEEELLLARFTRVFEQTYARFLDLKKAEAQAREAQIENALERVRSRTMAMQSSDELPEVANQLFTEVRALGIHAWSCGYNILADDKKTATCCMSSEGTMQTPFQLRFWGEASFDEMGDFILSDKTMLVQELAGKALEAHYAYMKSFPDLKPTFDELDRLGLSLPTYQINHLCKFTQGFILFITYEKVPDAHEIFKRFTNVFDQTYIRFLDLKKAEAQAREAIKQAALERVRGEIASMRSANDLEIITPLVWRELTNLGIPFIRCGVFIVDGKKETVEVHLSSPDGKPLAAMHLAFGANDLTLHAVEAWKKNEVHVQQWSKADFINYGKQMVAQGQVKDLQSYQGDAAAPELLYLHFIPFSQGLLYVGSLQPLLAEQIQLVTLLAKSFAIAYARYEDFIKLEQAKAEVEAAMSVLKATQSQLVQQEKLASLGQLTAGIAHEIKNPLNFVNNFTEISIELIEEAIAEIQKQDNDKDASLIDHNLDDIKANLKKVYEHGTRANSIVNAMLLHSRGGGGAPEPTLLNDFIREYSNLAFHGMRAGKEPLDVEMLFEWDENIREIPLILEDFSRVVLNICNNAFDAMREKKRKYEVGEDDTVKYKPTLSIKTRHENGKVHIQFEDNGPGIPDTIRDKILQPFFTTKKGTEGTGLGLSISHDIVKAHGGAIQVETKEGEGSEFIIILPDNNM